MRCPQRESSYPLQIVANVLQYISLSRNSYRTHDNNKVARLGEGEGVAPIGSVVTTATTGQSFDLLVSAV